MTESARDEALKLRRGPVSEETRLKMVEAQQNRRAHERRYWLIERGSPAEYSHLRRWRRTPAKSRRQCLGNYSQPLQPVPGGELTQIASEIGQYLGWTPGGMATDHERSGK